MKRGREVDGDRGDDDVSKRSRRNEPMPMAAEKTISSPSAAGDRDPQGVATVTMTRTDEQPRKGFPATPERSCQAQNSIITSSPGTISTSRTASASAVTLTEQVSSSRDVVQTSLSRRVFATASTASAADKAGSRAASRVISEFGELPELVLGRTSSTITSGQHPSSCTSTTGQHPSSCAELLETCDDAARKEREKESDSGASDDEQVKSQRKRRGEIEKKRRDRINNCLEELKSLIPEASRKGNTKVEKAEILTLTVEFLRATTRGLAPHEVIAQDYHSRGYRECMSDTLQYLAQHENFRADQQQNLRQHLTQCLLYSESTPASRAAATSTILGEDFPANAIVSMPDVINPSNAAQPSQLVSAHNAGIFSKDSRPVLELPISTRSLYQYGPTPQSPLTSPHTAIPTPHSPFTPQKACPPMSLLSPAKSNPSPNARSQSLASGIVSSLHAQLPNQFSMEGASNRSRQRGAPMVGAPSQNANIPSPFSSLPLHAQNAFGVRGHSTPIAQSPAGVETDVKSASAYSTTSSMYHYPTSDYSTEQDTTMPTLALHQQQPQPVAPFYHPHQQQPQNDICSIESLILPSQGTGAYDSRTHSMPQGSLAYHLAAGGSSQSEQAKVKEELCSPFQSTQAGLSPMLPGTWGQR
eukprot:scpid29795/ scgid0202/ Hairy/enhancer-of-split related with YRPW motif protein